MAIRFLFILTFALSYISSHSQDTTFIYTYGGLSYDQGKSVIATNDGGFALIGSTGSMGAGNSDVYLVKVDSGGVYQWSKTYGGMHTEQGNSIQETSDLGFIIAGYSNSYGSGSYDFYLIRTDSIGDTLWTKTFGGTELDMAHNVIQTRDGGFAIVGETYSYGAGGNDVFLVKTDSMGDSLWTKTFGGINDDYGRALQETSDTGLIIVGGTNSYGNGKLDAYAIKTDANGDTTWTSAIGYTQDEYALDVVQGNDLNYVIIGSTESIGNGGSDMYLFKLDTNGVVKWDKSVGGTENDGGRSISKDLGNGYACLSYSKSWGFVGTLDLLVQFTDGDGVYVGQITYGQNADDNPWTITQTKDSAYVIIGTTNSFGAGLDDIFLLKMDLNGMDWMGNPITPLTPVSHFTDTSMPLTLVGIEDNYHINSGLIVYPNPTTTNFIVDLTDTELNGQQVEFYLYNSLGKAVLRKTACNVDYINVKRGLLKDGIYFYRLYSIESAIDHLYSGNIILLSR